MIAAGARRRIRHADGMGRRGAQAESARQCRHAGRRARRASSSAPRASGFAAPSTCSSTSDRIRAVREMILADDEAARRAALAKLLPMQREDFAELFEIMGGAAGDHPPARSAAARVPAAHRGRDRRSREGDGRRSEEARATAPRELHEFNPMLGFRGCRLAIAYPEIAEMQARAIFEAAVEAAQADRQAGRAGDHGAADRHQGRARSGEGAHRRHGGGGRRRRPSAKVDYQVGTMIELPRAALRAGEIAETAEFFSFGTNDLTQTTFGISRDDAASFLGIYTAKGILAGRSVRVDRPRGRRRTDAHRRRARPQGRARTSSSASAASTAAIRPRSRSATRSGSTMCRARRSACRSRASPPRRRRSARSQDSRPGRGRQLRSGLLTGLFSIARRRQLPTGNGVYLGARAGGDAPLTRSQG